MNKEKTIEKEVAPAAASEKGKAKLSAALRANLKRRKTPAVRKPTS